ncbi:MAG TPA: nucleotidyltransferase family protein [Trueperaceae bacterium]|nr:nucleotidyltransferase family protein [Trueperaceae bacterium]
MAAAAGDRTTNRTVTAMESGSKARELRAARALLPEVIDWLCRSPPAPLAARLADLSQRRGPDLRSLLTNQGLAPLVAALLEEQAGPGPSKSAPPANASELVPTQPLLQSATADWLRLQLEQNRVRMAAFAGDLGLILETAAAAGLRLMPLKGSVLSDRYYREPALRPMADIDLLVSPDDEKGLHEILVRLGYRLLSETEARHRSYRRPGDSVVSYDGTHPGNPRPVEVHTVLRRSVWLDRGGVDFAPLMWAAGLESLLHGQAVMLPSAEALLLDVAAHATSHLMRGSGMLLQLVDLRRIAVTARTIPDTHAEWTYPALALTARVFPDAIEASELGRLAQRVAPSLRRLTDSLPLDDRAGLNLRGVNPNGFGSWGIRWQRWKANPWLVCLANPALPPVLAYPAYLGGVGARAARRLTRPSARG